MATTTPPPHWHSLRGAARTTAHSGDRNRITTREPTPDCGGIACTTPFGENAEFRGVGFFRAETVRYDSVVMHEERSGRGGGTGDVLIAIGAIGLVIVVVALTAYWAGRGNAPATAASATTATSAPAAVDPQVAVGAHAFVQFSCGQCHGPQGAGGVSPDVPDLQSVASTLTSQQLTSIIEHGAGVSSTPTKPYMPVWKGVISKNQIDALVAYIKAGFPQVSGATPTEVPTNQGDVVAGMALYDGYGCVNCHGPNALGGVPNPASPDGTIPALVGAASTRSSTARQWPT